MHLADCGPERRRQGGGGPGGGGGGGGGPWGGVAAPRPGAGGPRKAAGVVLNITPRDVHVWRTPSNMAGHPASLPRAPNAEAGCAEEGATGKPESEAPLPPILTLPPEALAHALGMLDPLEVVAASCAHPDWLEVANHLVLAPRGHLAVRLGRPRPEPPPLSRALLHTVHLVGDVDEEVSVRDAVQSLGRTVPMEAVHSLWLHGDGGESDTPAAADPGRRHQHLHRPEASRRSNLDAILELFPNVTSINFSNVPQCATYVKLIVEVGPRPHFRSRFVFTERNHHTTSVLVALEELGAFFEETMVTVWRPQLSVTASFPHYWDPRCRLQLPYPADVHQLCLYGSGLQPTAYLDVASLTHLQELLLFDADGLSDEALLSVATRVRCLRRLSIHDAPSVSSAGWGAALRGRALRGLHILEVGGCLQLDDDALRSAVPLEALTTLVLDLEGCSKVSGVAVDAALAVAPHVECLTLILAFSPSVVEALERAPARLNRLRKLVVRIQCTTWPGDPREAMAGVDRLKRSLRATCPTSVQMEVSLTFVKLGMAVSSAPEELEPS